MNHACKSHAYTIEACIQELLCKRCRSDAATTCSIYESAPAAKHRGQRVQQESNDLVGVHSIGACPIVGSRLWSIVHAADIARLSSILRCARSSCDIMRHTHTHIHTLRLVRSHGAHLKSLLYVLRPDIDNDVALVRRRRIPFRHGTVESGGVAKDSKNREIMLQRTPVPNPNFHKVGTCNDVKGHDCEAGYKMHDNSGIE